MELTNITTDFLEETFPQLMISFGSALDRIENEEALLIPPNIIDEEDFTGFDALITNNNTEAETLLIDISKSDPKLTGDVINGLLESEYPLLLFRTPDLQKEFGIEKGHYLKENSTPPSPSAPDLTDTSLGQIPQVRRVDPDRLIDPAQTLPRCKELIDKVRSGNTNLGYPPDKYFCWTEDGAEDEEQIRSLPVISETEVRIMVQKGTAIPIPSGMVEYGTYSFALEAVPGLSSSSSFVDMANNCYSEDKIFVLDLTDTEEFVRGAFYSQLIASKYPVVMYRS